MGINIIVNGRDFCSDNEIPETWWASVGNYGFSLHSTLKSKLALCTGIP
jgi:hypothetical protein